MIDKEIEKVELHYIKQESQSTPVVNYSGDDESQGYSDDYVFSATDVTDARRLKNKKEFKLDREGFKLVSFSPKEVNYSSSDEVQKSYYLEVEQLVKEQTGASDVFVFDHTVRRGLEDSNRRPAYHVHNDYTFETGEIRAVDVLGKETVEMFGVLSQVMSKEIHWR